MDDVAIKVDNVSKDFVLPHERNTSIKSAFINLFRAHKKGYEIQRALKDVAFEVKKGEFFGIVGRNGSGKSTLLKILANIYQPNKGTVHVNGRVVPFIELGVGFNPELTGRDNIFLNGALLGFSRKEILAMYDDVVEFAELERFMDQKLKNYSSGMQVRLAFSLAVRAQADILLVDEVLAVGDADFQRKCFNYFKTLKKNKKTVVFVSHDMSAVREYCDRAMLIEDSRISEIGNTDKITEKYIKLFLDPTILVREQDQEANRWGDRSMRFTDVSVKVETDAIIITEKITAKTDMENPVAGFRIRDAAGEDVTGTNTKKEKIKFGPLLRGDKVTIEWRMSNILSDGEYSLDPSLLHYDEITVADWWNDAHHFVVSKDRDLPYTIDPGFKVSIRK